MKSMLIKHTGLIIVSAFMVTACSQNADNMATQQTSSSAVETKQETVKVVTGDTHTHPANECTNSIEHTHPNGKRPHKHHYSCKPNARKMTHHVYHKGEQHTHPANKCTRTISHSHPNGKRPHKHHYSCKPKVAACKPAQPIHYPGQEHTHPANKCTRTISHSHPNGKRPHKHFYSCKPTARKLPPMACHAGQ